MANGARQERRTQLFFLEGAMDDFRDDFETYIDGLSPEQVEILERGRDIVESMFEDVAEAVNNFATSRRPVRNQDG
tara:strand:- start:134 stop:361 length:228 start_codon:yes stop_codon:yes gene_type:complete